MSTRLASLDARFNLVTLAGPLLVILIIGMMMLPLPPLLLDLLFSFNIALSIIVMLVAFYTLRPLEFSIFPTLLLIATLFRLSLNIASTRVVLMQGHTGPDAAGKVIESFGHFLIGSNYAVGIIVFTILVIINFIVITKGAGRIAEVSARFTLDALPGRQLAIDADLQSGAIDETQARKRRDDLAREAEFFGAMDGASKFVRGDAVAAILIVLINIIGGLAIGMSQHGLDFASAVNNYTLLTIGDGLVAQIPALMISTAAGVMVSRVASEQNVGQQLFGQLFGRYQAVAVAAAILALLGLIPGMPHFAFLSLAIVLGALSWSLYRRRSGFGARVAPEPVDDILPDADDIGWGDVAVADPLELEVGLRLVPLVDRDEDGELLRRIFELRRAIAQERGFLVPAVRIRDNLRLRANAYRILLKGVPIAQGEVDTARGQPAASIAEHLAGVIEAHAAELLNRDDVMDLLRNASPRQADELVPGMLPLGTVQRVLQNLLAERVPVRDMRGIVDTLADRARLTQQPEALTEAVRAALARAIVQDIYGDAQVLDVAVLDSALEAALEASLHEPATLALEPGLAETLIAALARLRTTLAGERGVILVSEPLRLALARFAMRAGFDFAILAHGEIPFGRSVQTAHIVGASDAA